MESNVLYAFLLSLFAGLSTGIGGIMAFFIKKDNIIALSVGLGFSAGVMIYVSFTEILKESLNYLTDYFGANNSEWINIVFFFTGIIIAALIDRLLPEEISHHIFNSSESICTSKRKLCRTGLFMAVVLAVHNYTEGLATFMSGLTDITLGISIAIAIAIHNIPEGIAVALPIYHSTGSKRKAFAISILSGIAEPIGALAGYFFLMSVMNGFAFGALLAIIAGIMVYISFDELLPMAREYGNGHAEIFGVISGMLVMAISLILLR